MCFVGFPFDLCKHSSRLLRAGANRSWAIQTLKRSSTQTSSRPLTTEGPKYPAIQHRGPTVASSSFINLLAFSEAQRHRHRLWQRLNVIYYLHYTLITIIANIIICMVGLGGPLLIAYQISVCCPVHFSLDFVHFWTACYL